MSDTAKLVIDGTKADEKLTNDIAVIEYTDNDEYHADDLQIVTYNPAEWYGKETIEYTITDNDWHENSKAVEMKCGIFNIDCIKRDDINGLYVIKAAAVPPGSTARQNKKSKAWERINLKELGQQIAKQNGLNFLYATELNPIFKRKEQIEKSDILFLSELCRATGLFLKFTANTIVIYNPYEYAEKEEKRTYSNGDANIQGIELKKQKNDTNYKKCRVTYLDPITKEKIEYIYKKESEGKMLDVTRKVSSTEEARLTAIYAIREKNGKEYCGKMTIDGDKEITTGTVIKINGFGEHDGNYLVKKAIHTMRTGTYTTRIFFEKVAEGNNG